MVFELFVYKVLGGEGVSWCIHRILHSQLQVSVHCPVLYHYMFGVVYGKENQPFLNRRDIIYNIIIWLLLHLSKTILLHNRLMRVVIPELSMYKNKVSIQEFYTKFLFKDWLDESAHERIAWRFINQTPWLWYYHATWTYMASTLHRQTNKQKPQQNFFVGSSISYKKDVCK